MNNLIEELSSTVSTRAGALIENHSNAQISTSLPEHLVDDEIVRNKLNNQIKIHQVHSYYTGLVDAIKAGLNKRDLSPDITYIQNSVDFAFVFTFGDNEYTDIMNKVVLEYLTNYNQVQFQINSLFFHLEKSQYAIYLEESLDILKVPDNIKQIFKTTFCGLYLSNDLNTIPRLGICYSYTKSLSEARRLVEDYIQFDDNDNWFFGTNKEVDNYLDKNFHVIDPKVLKNNNETLIVRVKNGYMKHYFI